MSKRIGLTLFVLVSVLMAPGVNSFGQGIEIESGASIIATGAASIEITDGGFTNNGTYTKATETVTFSGTTAGTISGSNITDFYNLSNSNSGGITISAGTAVTVSNDFSNTGTFSINSDVTSNGSFIVGGTSTGNVTYNRWVSANNWHLLSSPVGGQPISAFASGNSIAINTGKLGVAPYNNATPAWEHYADDYSGSDNFTPGKGYEMQRTAAGVLPFTGTVNTSNVSIGITTPASPGTSWNLVGNPFTAAINANEAEDDPNNFLTGNTGVLDASYIAIYFWDAASSSYVTVNQTEATYIAPGQAFFVYSADGGGSLSFTEAMQTHQRGDIFKKSMPATHPAIGLFAEYPSGKSNTTINYIENMTTGLDPGYDAGRFSGGDNSFAVYTHLVDDRESKEDFDIQCLPIGEFDHVIPIGLNAPENSEIVFHVETENLPPDVPVYLEDKVMETFTALHESGNVYDVVISEQIAGLGRFYLHTKSATGAWQLANNRPGFSIIPRPEQNCIHIIGDHAGNEIQVAIFDISGRKLKATRLNKGSGDVDMAGFRSGVYIVSIQSSIQQTSKKIPWIRPY